MDSSKRGELHQQAMCYVYGLHLRSILLKLSIERFSSFDTNRLFFEVHQQKNRNVTYTTANFVSQFLTAVVACSAPKHVSAIFNRHIDQKKKIFLCVR